MKVHRLGFLSLGNPTAQAANLDLFRQALGELGYVEGQNLAIEYRWGEGSDARLAEPAAELARLPVDVFVVPSADGRPDRARGDHDGAHRPGRRGPTRWRRASRRATPAPGATSRG